MLRAYLVILGMLMALPAWAGQVVKVGGYEFAPFVEMNAAGKPDGLALRLIEAMNAHQDRFTFQFVPTSPNRRYKDFEAGQFDVILFESPDWGWVERKLPIQPSRVFLDGGEIYITQAKPGRDQGFFAELGDKRMVGILGYHYGFAGFEADPAVLASRFRMALVNDNAASIEMILKERGDVAVVTDAYLKRWLRSRPEARSRLLVSERFDQRYAHHALVRAGGAFTAADMDRLLDAMDKDGTLAGLWRNFGIKD
ncbi:substrate-binding periplasmic protein [Paramagnetospirillum magneticum]|uniref:ABC-type amino acid transport/signal transduction systems, periplasmic component/domain n=1 Tax=Paramagnetospirillum magneticum (strain ATCC 700264 / AMB-1) TaxID=342108 RepID=Q2W1L9_PARM1|nr:transporter substrate-binding domain-containing protein [Paramagnetospirillum magneticum]BAE52256.1 ABC-type amino acid transport/signal transduction systems, periplasmic component/domain [Paramagnetospirillum magneticum AMB-1]